MSNFILSCASTVDLPYEYVSGRDISVIFYRYTVGEAEYTDDMGRTPGEMQRFYQLLRGIELPHTSQINEFGYTEYFEPLLQKGDVLHIAFGSGMSGSVNNAFRAAEALREKYPERRIEVVDSLCSSSGYGMLVDYAADLRDEGRSMDETLEQINDMKGRIPHQFFSTDLNFFRRSGRMSGTAATLGALLNICPLMHLNAAGKIIAYDKVRGMKNAIRETVKVMEQHAEGGENYNGKCFICHSDCLDNAKALQAAIEKKFPQLRGKIRICDIGTIIASHSGPGTTAVFFVGDNRPE